MQHEVVEEVCGLHQSVMNTSANTAVAKTPAAAYHPIQFSASENISPSYGKQHHPTFVVV